MSRIVSAALKISREMKRRFAFAKTATPLLKRVAYVEEDSVVAAVNRPNVLYAWREI